VLGTGMLSAGQDLRTALLHFNNQNNRLHPSHHVVFFMTKLALSKNGISFHSKLA